MGVKAVMDRVQLMNLATYNNAKVITGLSKAYHSRQIIGMLLFAKPTLGPLIHS